MITVGAVYGGPEHRDSRVCAIISAVGLAATEARGPFEFGTAPAVNVVYYVPGSLDRPDWTGLRDGRFSRKEQMLMVQVALPEKVVGGEGALDFAIEALYGANAIAFDVFDEKGMQYPLREAEALVERIAELARRNLGQ